MQLVRRNFSWIDRYLSTDQYFLVSIYPSFYPSICLKYRHTIAMFSQSHCNLRLTLTLLTRRTRERGVRQDPRRYSPSTPNRYKKSSSHLTGRCAHIVLEPAAPAPAFYVGTGVRSRIRVSFSYHEGGDGASANLKKITGAGARFHSTSRSRTVYF